MGTMALGAAAWNSVTRLPPPRGSSESAAAISWSRASVLSVSSVLRMLAEPRSLSNMVRILSACSPSGSSIFSSCSFHFLFGDLDALGARELAQDEGAEEPFLGGLAVHLAKLVGCLADLGEVGLVGAHVAAVAFADELVDLAVEEDLRVLDLGEADQLVDDLEAVGLIGLALERLLEVAADALVEVADGLELLGVDLLGKVVVPRPATPPPSRI